MANARELLQGKDSKSQSQGVKDMPSYINTEYHIPLIDGKVSVRFETEEGLFEYEFIQQPPQYFIHDACVVDGLYVHALRGQSFNHYICGILKEAKGSLKEHRLFYCVFLRQVQEAFQRKEEYVETIFGLKYLDYGKKSEKAKSSWKRYI